jgi:hypothetical protein
MSGHFICNACGYDGGEHADYCKYLRPTDERWKGNRKEAALPTPAPGGMELADEISAWLFGTTAMEEKDCRTLASNLVNRFSRRTAGRLRKVSDGKFD